jgi:hypothetical protein
MYRRSTWLRATEEGEVSAEDPVVESEAERLAQVAAEEARQAAGSIKASGGASAKTFKREGYERRIDDAHAIIPWIFGAFRHPSRNGYKIGQPLLEYAAPEINLNTGQWKYHVNDAMDTVKRAMRATNRDILDLLALVDRKDQSGVSVAITPLEQILTSIDAIEGKISHNLSDVTIKTRIIDNHVTFRYHILKAIEDGIGRFDDATSKAELKAELRSAVLHEHEKEVSAIEKLDLKGGVGLTMDCFSGVDSLETVFADLIASKQSVMDLMKAQEKEKLGSIKYSIVAVRAVYKKIIIALKKDRKVDLLNILRNQLVKHGKQNNVDRSQTSQQDKIIREFLEHLVMERVELLYGHMYTYFSVTIGKHHEEIDRLTKDFMGAAVLSIMQPLLEVEFRDNVLLDQFYQETPDVKDPVANVLHAVQKSGSAVFNTYKDAIFSNVKPIQLSYETDVKATLAVINKINDSVWKKENPAGLNSRARLSDLHIEPTLKAFRDIVDNLKKISDDVKSVFNQYKVPQQTFLHRTQITVDPAKDALFEKLQELVGDNHTHKFSFSILSNAILFDQRVNPSFAAHFILQNIVGRDRPSSAHWYFTKTNNLFSKSAQLYARGETFDTLEWPKYPVKTGAVHGDVLPTANSTIADLRLKNVDAITPLTQPVRPKSAAQKSKKKKADKPKTPAQSTRDSVTKKGGVTVGKKNKKKTDQKKK